MTAQSSTRPAWIKPAIRFGLILACSGVAGYGVGHLAAEVFPSEGDILPDFRWADVLAVGLSASMIVSAVFLAFASLRPASLGKLLKLEGPAGGDEIRDVRLQALIFTLSGVIMLLPPTLMALSVPAAPAMAGILALLVVHTLLNVRLYRSVDELLRRVVMDSGAITFWLGQGLLFVWAAAERLQLAPPITAWDAYVVLMGVYLAVSMVVTMRRGLA